jgi:DNA-binding Lrp family transcriptional regulator
MHSIMAGNIGHFDQDPRNAGQFTALEDVPPDNVRRPISVLAVANGLGIPYETVRRHVSRLVKAGRCVRVKGGVLAPAAGMRRPETDAAIMHNLANLCRLYRV